MLDERVHGDLGEGQYYSDGRRYFLDVCSRLRVFWTSPHHGVLGCVLDGWATAYCRNLQSLHQREDGVWNPSLSLSLSLVNARMLDRSVDSGR